MSTTTMIVEVNEKGTKEWREFVALNQGFSLPDEAGVQAVRIMAKTGIPGVERILLREIEGADGKFGFVVCKDKEIDALWTALMNNAISHFGVINTLKAQGRSAVKDGASWIGSAVTKAPFAADFAVVRVRLNGQTASVAVFPYANGKEIAAEKQIFSSIPAAKVVLKDEKGGLRAIENALGQARRGNGDHRR